jgi:alpha-methylacyl-CoA racemase
VVADGTDISGVSIDLWPAYLIRLCSLVRDAVLSTASPERSDLELNRFRVVDLTRNFPGPFASHLLADMGMDVIKVEEPYPRGGVGRDPLTPPEISLDEERQLAAYNALARNKRSLALDLMGTTDRARARDVLYRLVATSDVVIEAYRPGVAASIGADYETIGRHNASIIYCSMSAFGQEGPYEGRPAHGGQMESIAGVVTFASDGTPFRFPVPVADTAGAFYAVITILGALLQRQSNKRGAHLDVSMTASALSLLVMQISQSQNPQAFSPGTVSSATIQFLECGDGRWLSTGNVETYYWERFCQALGHPEWIGLREGPAEAIEAMASDVRRIFASRPRDYWLERLVAYGTCVAPVNRPIEAFEDPQMVHFGMRHELHAAPGLVAQLGFPVRIDGSDYLQDIRVAPVIGADTRSLLDELGYAQTEIDDLSRDGIVRITRTAAQ